MLCMYDHTLSCTVVVTHSCRIYASLTSGTQQEEYNRRGEGPQEAQTYITHFLLSAVVDCELEQLR